MEHLWGKLGALNAQRQAQPTGKRDDMQRTPEPELMDDKTQALAYAQADFSETDRALAQRFCALAQAHLHTPTPPIADLGCGPGNIAIQLHALRPGWDITGYDGAQAMITLAQQTAPHLRFEQRNLPDPDLPQAHFQGVISNSLLHHLHDPAHLWQTIKHISAPGALVVVQDLRRPSSPEAAQTLVDLYAKDAPPVLQRDFLASLHAAFTPDEIAAQLHAHDLAHWQIETISDRHVLIWGLAP